MRKRVFSTCIFAGAVIAGVSAVGHADVVLDTLTNATVTGNLAGSSPDINSGNSETWSADYTNNDAVLTPSAQYVSSQSQSTWPTMITGGSYSGIQPIIPVRSTTGTVFGTTDTHTDDNGFIGVSPAGPVTETTNLAFNSEASTSGTAWAFVSLLNSTSVSSGVPDVETSSTSDVLAWVFIRPSLASGNYAEIFFGGGTGTPVTSLTSIPTADGGSWPLTHTVSFAYNPASGLVSATIDGTTISGTETTGLTVQGAMIGDRSMTGDVSATNPSYALFSNFSVVPEPMSFATAAVGGAMLMLRRRRVSRK